MNIVLIIFIILMSYIAYKYNDGNKFENFFINLFVQLLHIATLVLILYTSITRGSFIVWIFCILGAYTIVNIILELISDIIDTFFPVEEEQEDIEPSNKDKIDTNNEQIQSETKVDKKEEEQ